MRYMLIAVFCLLVAAGCVRGKTESAGDSTQSTPESLRDEQAKATPRLDRKAEGTREGVKRQGYTEGGGAEGAGLDSTAQDDFKGNGQTPEEKLPDGDLDNGTEPSPVDDNPVNPGKPAQPSWQVEPFASKKGWLPKKAASLSGEDWGAQLANKVVERLRHRAVNAKAARDKLTDEQVTHLITKDNLWFVVSGTLEKLELGEGKATLTASALVRKRIHTDDTGVKVTEVTRKHSSMEWKGKVFGKSEMSQLLDVAAGEIAGQILTDLPDDLIAERN